MVQHDGAVDYHCDGLEAEGGICPQEKFPILWPEHFTLWKIFMKALPGLMDGMGGFNYGAIESTFNLMGIEQKYREKLFNDIMKLVNVIQKEREKRRENAQGQNTQGIIK